MKENNKSFLLGLSAGIGASLLTFGISFFAYKKIAKTKIKHKSEKEIIEDNIEELEKTLILLNKNISKIDEIMMLAWDEETLSFIVPKNMTESEFEQLKTKRNDLYNLAPDYKKEIEKQYLKLQYLELNEMKKKGE